MERITKKGRKIVAEVKAYMVKAKIDLKAGKLTERGEAKKIFSDIKVKKELKAGDKFCLRLAYRRPDGKYLAYAHGEGWILVNDLNEAFEPTKKTDNLELLILKDFLTLDVVEKVRDLAYKFDFKDLTKTEQMLIAYLKNQDLAKVEEEIKCDKSLKSKVKNHTEKFCQVFYDKRNEEIKQLLSIN